MKFFLNAEWMFNRLANEMSFRRYKANAHPARVQSKKFIMDFINQSHSVLDIGCGQGILSMVIAEKANKVVAVDHNVDSIEKAKKESRSHNLQFVCADAVNYLRTEQLFFDIMILSHVLEHLDEPKEFLKQFKKHFCYIYIEVPDFDNSYLNQYRKDLGMPHLFSDADHIFEFDRDDIAEILDSSNLEMISSEFRYGVQKYWTRVRRIGQV